MTQTKNTILEIGGRIIDVAKINLTYDAAFTIALEDNPKLAKAILAPIIQRNDFQVVSVQTHVQSESFRQRSVGFDCLVVFDDGTHCDVEMQKIKSRMPLERMIFYRSVLQAGYSMKKGDLEYEHMTPSIVVIILDGDLLGQGQPLYRFSYHNAETRKDMEPSQGIYVANLRMRDSSTELGRLMEDINACEPEKVHDSTLGDALEMLKSDQGIKRMSEFWEKVNEEDAIRWMEQGAKKAKKDLLVSQFKDGEITAEQAAKRLGIPVEQFLMLVEG